MSLTFYWHDYETWGVNPRRDRAVQFAGIRTDADLNIMDKPLMIYARPANDMLPSPEACLVTGITPQEAMKQGIPEAEFFHEIHREFMLPGTCGVGYNTIRFDDEVTRFGFFRNFFDPYAREWKDGNSRWDIIDLVRTAYALRPEGIEWPEGEDGKPSFRLEKLTEANGIGHAAAHDALSDVEATIAMAKLIKEKQPRLFAYHLKLRNKREVSPLLPVGQWKPMLHISGMYPMEKGCMAVVVPVSVHPDNPNGIIVYDLSVDPSELADLSVEQIQQRLFVKAADLPEGVQRIPLKTIHVNKSPSVVPLSTLTDELKQKWSLDFAQIEKNLMTLRQIVGLSEKIQQVHVSPFGDDELDVDESLYSGGFFSRSDRAAMDRLRNLEPDQLALVNDRYDDPRIAEMLFRYRARNWPESLSSKEKQRWDEFRVSRLKDEASELNLKSYRQTLAKMMIDPELSDQQREILSELADWPGQIGF